MGTDMDLPRSTEFCWFLVFAWIEPNDGLIDEASITIFEEQIEL